MLVRIGERANGRFAFVGDVPVALGTPHKASVDETKGGCTGYDDNGVLVAFDWPEFDSYELAAEMVTAAGHDPVSYGAIREDDDDPYCDDGRGPVWSS